MEVTNFLATMIGIPLTVISLHCLVDRDNYKSYCKNLTNSSVNTFMMALMLMVLGLLVVLNHNLWDNLLNGLISFIGWLMIVKSVLLLFFLDFVKRVKVNNSVAKLDSLVGLAIGLYLVSQGVQL